MTKKTQAADKHSRPYRILVVGPALDQKGGMASVQKLILKEMPVVFLAEHISTHDEGSLWHRTRVFAVATAILMRKLLRNRADLVHLHVSEKGSVLRKILLLLLVKAFRRPVVMHAHGCEFHIFHQGLNRTARSIVNWSLQQADCFVTLSEGWRTYYISHCELDSSKAIALPNPVEMPILSELPESLSNDGSNNGAIDSSNNRSDNKSHNKPSTTVNFAFLGRIGHRKGAFDLIRAFALLPNRTQARLWLAGDGEIDAAAALIASLGLGESVRLLGWVGETQRAKVLASAHAFVLPSYNEALPMAMLEAMAAALPVVSTPVGGIPEFVTDGQEGYLVEPGDVGALSQAMARLIDSETQRRLMGRRSRDRVRPLDLKCYNQQLSKIYVALLNNKLYDAQPLGRSVDRSLEEKTPNDARSQSQIHAVTNRSSPSAQAPMTQAPVASRPQPPLTASSPPSNSQ